MRTLHTYLTEALDGSRMKYTGKHTQFADIIIENEKGEILILRRANYMKNFRTCWCIPGGNVDVKDKNTVETVVRETMEETGIEIDMAQQLKLKPIFTYKFENGNVSDIYYIKLENTPDVKLSREHSKYEWVRFSDEKIDARKWVPETFTILQKWETKPMNEKLIVNKDYAVGKKQKVYVENQEELLKIIDREMSELPETETFLDLSFVDTSDVEDFCDLFNAYAVKNFKRLTVIDLTGWDLGKATTCSKMFIGCENLEKIVGIEDWHVDKIENMRGMFFGCKKLKMDLTEWNPLIKVDTAKMFRDVPNESIPYEWIKYTKYYQRNKRYHL